MVSRAKSIVIIIHAFYEFMQHGVQMTKSRNSFVRLFVYSYMNAL